MALFGGVCFSHFREVFHNSGVSQPSQRGPKAEAYRILQAYDFGDLSACFRVMDRFVRWTEDQRSTMPNAWPTAVRIFRDLDILRQQGNLYAGSFHQTFYTRLTETADVPQLLLGYLITEEGIRWYRALPDVPSPMVMTSRQYVDGQISSLLSHFRRLLVADPNVFFAGWKFVLTEMTFETGMKIDAFWDQVRGGKFSLSGQVWFLRPIAELAAILSRLPVSEAEVERTFSRMRLLFGDRGQRAKEDLIEARLAIHMNKIVISPEMAASLDKLEDRDVYHHRPTPPPDQRRPLPEPDIERVRWIFSEPLTRVEPLRPPAHRVARPRLGVSELPQSQD
jgi:hypothetical protein